MPKRLHLVAALTAVLLWSGCETNVDPFIEDDRFYTIFGYLDTATDLQALRVVPLRQVIGEESQTIDATVLSTELETGATVEWQPERIEYSDGSSGFVFRGALRPIPGFTYRIDVVRSDGASASAQTTIPPAPGIAVSEPEIAVADVFQRVFWEDIPAAPFRVEIWYRFMGVTPSDPFLDAVLTYQDVKFGQARNGGWEAIVRLTEDRLLVAQELDVSEDAALTLLGVGARLTMSDDAWRPPGGVFDREVLVQPGTFSNVDNGFGFLGAVNQFTAEWTLTPELTERIGYSFPGSAAD
ncbi:MAG: DUF4249 family protein [Rhodothermales bacterium]|nr:DUF4249 family protein [Rhodothermales bacterium]MBO6778900.1 DUF4249 family protein [Rhodothermales bacterium]